MFFERVAAILMLGQKAALLLPNGTVITIMLCGQVCASI